MKMKEGTLKFLAAKTRNSYWVAKALNLQLNIVQSRLNLYAV